MYLLYYYLTTYLIYLKYFIFCNRKKRLKNELKTKKKFKTCFKQTLIKTRFLTTLRTPNIDSS